MGKRDLDEITIVPPLKWAGGKRWFAQAYGHLLPEKYNAYFEPFFGSGALFFKVQPGQAYLSDINEELINLYGVIKAEPDELARKLSIHQRRHDSAYYYSVRSSRPKVASSRAARTLYLNRTCWNGLYRVNLKGEFNVPKGSKDNVMLPTDNFSLLSSVLQEVNFDCCDFESAIDRSGKGDFMFIDPPYTVAHNNNGFIKYNQNLFCWDDQLRLRDAILRAVNRGVKVLVTNAAHESVRALYSGFDILNIERAGVIAGTNAARGRYMEMVARWY